MRTMSSGSADIGAVSAGHGVMRREPSMVQRLDASPRAARSRRSRLHGAKQAQMLRHRCGETVFRRGDGGRARCPENRLDVRAAGAPLNGEERYVARGTMMVTGSTG